MSRVRAVATLAVAIILTWPARSSAQPLPASCDFTDNQLVAEQITIKAAHLQELRACIDDLRTQRGLATVSWTDPVLIPGQTTAKAVHLTELRAALIEAYGRVGRSAPDFGPPPMATLTTIRASHLMALRDAGIALAGCEYALSPGSITVGSGASTGSVTLGTQTGCGWTAVSQAGWIQVTSGQSGSGSGSIGYSVAVNESAEERSGTIIIGAMSFPVTQTGQDAPVTYSADVDTPALETSENPATGDGEGDLIQPITCHGRGSANYSWAYLLLKITLLVDGQLKATTEVFGQGSVQGSVTYLLHASVADRRLECRAQVGNQTDSDIRTLLGSGPASIRLTTGAFIPDNWISHPVLPWVTFAGDDRGFVESGTARGSQVADILNSAVSNGSFSSGPHNYVGLTESFDRETSLTESDPIVLTTEARNDWERQPPMKIDWDTASTQAMSHQFSRLGPSQYLFSKIRHTSIVSIQNPLVPFSPSIDYRMIFTLTFGLNQVEYTIEGCHDGYPAYEAYLGGQTIYARAPGNIMELFGDCDTTMERIMGVIK